MGKNASVFRSMMALYHHSILLAFAAEQSSLVKDQSFGTLAGQWFRSQKELQVKKRKGGSSLLLSGVLCFFESNLLWLVFLYFFPVFLSMDYSVLLHTQQEWPAQHFPLLFMKSPQKILHWSILIKMLHSVKGPSKIIFHIQCQEQLTCLLLLIYSVHMSSHHGLCSVDIECSIYSRCLHFGINSWLHSPQFHFTCWRSGKVLLLCAQQSHWCYTYFVCRGFCKTCMWFNGINLCTVRFWRNNAVDYRITCMYSYSPAKLYRGPNCMA